MCSNEICDYAVRSAGSAASTGRPSYRLPAPAQGVGRDVSPPRAASIDLARSGGAPFRRATGPTGGNIERTVLPGSQVTSCPWSRPRDCSGYLDGKRTRARAGRHPAHDLPRPRRGKLRQLGWDTSDGTATVHVGATRGQGSGPARLKCAGPCRGDECGPDASAPRRAQLRKPWASSFKTQLTGETMLLSWPRRHSSGRRGLGGGAGARCAGQSVSRGG